MSTLIELVTSHGAFVLITVFMGGAAAYATGKALAQTWRPFWHLLVYIAGMAAVTRFCHFALFEEDLLDPIGYLIDLAVLVAAASVGYRVMRAKQMAIQYDWLFEAAGPFAWKRRK